LVGLLRTRGPLTATEAGDLVGESAASCSFHFRQLAKYGLVEDAGGGQGRERPWRATAQFTSWSDVAVDPERTAASTMLSRVVAERYFERVLLWLRRRDREPRKWRAAADLSDFFLYLTAEELRTLLSRMQKLLDPYLPRNQDPALRPPASRSVAFIRLAFPQTYEPLLGTGKRGAAARRARRR
jgi:predicted ArsR family transcriptional regulator